MTAAINGLAFSKTKAIAFGDRFAMTSFSLF